MADRSSDALTGLSGNTKDISETGPGYDRQWTYVTALVRVGGNIVTLPMLADTGSDFNLLVESQARELVGDYDTCTTTSIDMAISRSPVQILGKVKLPFFLLQGPTGQKYTTKFFVVPDECVHKAFCALISAKTAKEMELFGPGKNADLDLWN